MYTIFNGVNADEFTRGDREDDKVTELKKSFDCDYLLMFVGGLNGRKGEFDLLLAMHRIVQETKRAKLLLVGAGTMRDKARNAAKRLRLNGHVVFVDNMPHAELRDYYSACDLFILPSYSEGLPKVLLEAMVTEAAVVASDIPAHRGVIDSGATGYLFEIGNVDSLTKVITTALRDEKRCSIARNASDMVKEKYTWQAVAERLDRVYDNLLAS